MLDYFLKKYLLTNENVLHLYLYLEYFMSTKLNLVTLFNVWKSGLTLFAISYQGCSVLIALGISSNSNQFYDKLVVQIKYQHPHHFL